MSRNGVDDPKGEGVDGRRGPGAGDRRGERIYVALLRAYPRSFREEYRDELVEVFRLWRRQRLRDHGALGPGFWLRVVRDVAGTAWREWRHPIERVRVGTNQGGETMSGWTMDLGYAARRLVRSPGFSLTALLILVTVIGVNTTAFSVVNALLFQPPPFSEPDRVVDVLEDSDDGRPNSTSFPAFQDIERLEGAFARVAAISMSQGFLEMDTRLAPINVEYATSGYLDVLGLPPARGRWFEPAEDDPTGAPSAVVSYHWWRDRMGSDPAVLGSTLRIGGETVRVVGVGPERFSGGFGPLPLDVWLSISSMRATGGPARSLDQREDHPFIVRARLASGVTLDQAQRVVDRLAQELERTYPDSNAGRAITVLPLAGAGLPPGARANIVPAAALLMVMVGLVLVVGTLNLANLLLVRTGARVREMAVRLAMGAGRARLTRVVLSEAALLAALGGLGGLALAAVSFRLLATRRLSLGVPITLDVRMDVSVLLFTLGASALAALVVGLLPAARVTTRDVAASLRDDAASGLGAKRGVGLTGVLVASQVAVSVVLLAVAGVFAESLVRARAADPGFEWERTAYVQVSLLPLGLGFVETEQTYRTIEERVEALPGVEAATRAIQLPAAQFGTSTLLVGSALGGVDEPTEVAWNVVTPDFFEVMGIELLHGRPFSDDDTGGSEVAIVSEAMARAFWGRTDIVGESFRHENQPDDPVEVVGVASDVVVRSLGEAPTPSFYRPFGQWGGGRGSIFFRAENPAGAIADVRDRVRSVDPRILVLTSASSEAHLGDTLSRRRLVGTILLTLGSVAFGLALLGVYGVVSFAVSRRRHEVGIRIALGAGGPSVVGLFVRDVATVVGLGALAGLLLSLPAGHAVGTIFTGGAGNALLTTAVALTLVAVAMGATLVPATAAARTDPRETLRQD